MKIQDINKEISKAIKPSSYEGLNLPFNSLDDRVFEILNYLIFKEKISLNYSDINNLFDDIDLMEGVGEKGRDCALLKEQKNVGLIQCKKVATNITKPQFCQEIIKFLLHSILDRNLIHDINNFTYYFSVSHGLAGTTKRLIREFNNLILEEKDIEKWTELVISNYKAFEKTTYEQIKDELKDRLSKIKVKRILPQDLEADLTLMPQIRKQFFKTRTIVDTNEINQIFKKYLQPVLDTLKKESKKSINSFNTDFKDYLERSYRDYSSARTLVFGTQEKKLEDFYYPLQLVSKNITIKTDKYPNDLLPVYKNVIIVDNGGMGKSTIMKWLFIHSIKEKKGVPIFIELRRLSKDHLLIDEIISQISPINQVVNKQILLNLINDGNFIFFLDGYDEIRTTDKSDVTKDISLFISKASKNNQFIATSRPDNIEGAFNSFRTFNIKKLHVNESYKLIERIGNYNERSMILIKKIKENDLKNIKEFLINPLLVSLLYKKFEYRESIPLQKQEFYYEVFEALFKAHDVTKGTDYYVRPKISKLKFSQFFQVLRSLGYKSIQQNEVEFNKSVLTKFIDEAKTELPKLDFETEDLISDLTKAVPLFYKEGLSYRWAHKSILEYFAAEYICIDTKGDQEEVLSAIYNGSRFRNLFHVMDLCYDIDYKPFRNAVIYPLCKEINELYTSTFKSLISSGKVNIEKIRHRQFRLFIEDNYLFKSDQELKNNSQAKLKFGTKIPGIKFINRVSADNYYLGTVKKRDKQKQRLLILLLNQKKDSLFRIFKDRDFQFEKRNKRGFNFSKISIFPNTKYADVIKLSGLENQPENDPKYFENVSLFMRGAYFDYNEVIKIIKETEHDKSIANQDKKITTGFE